MEVGGREGLATPPASTYPPYCAYATAFSQLGLFLDKPFPRIASEKPVTSNCVINNKLLQRLPLTRAFEGFFSVFLKLSFRGRQSTVTMIFHAL